MLIRGFLYWLLASSFPAEEQLATIQMAMDEYKNRTNGCITFTQRTIQTNYVAFIK